MTLTPVVLTIAGSDSGGGAGIQADLRAIAANGCFGCTAITAVTAQNPDIVTGVWTIPAVGVRAQIAAVRAAFPIAAVKTGMLANAEIIEAVAAEVASLHVPLVVDPVMVATSGSVLLAADAQTALCRDLLPLATLITPNLPEAEALLGCTIHHPREAARALAARFNTAVLIKGGHRLTTGNAVDTLALANGEITEFTSPMVAALTTHGTGCTLAAAIAARLAHGRPLTAAIADAKAYITAALQTCLQLAPNRAALGAPRQ